MKNIGSLSPFKDNLGNVQIRMWDAVPDCDETCPTYETCPDAGTHKMCEIRRKYINCIFNDIKTLFKGDQMTAHKAGMLLMPLYTQLISFKLHAHSAGNNIYIKTKVNPVYKEMRETIKLINSLLNEMGVPMVGGNGAGKPGQPQSNTLLNGQSDYYDSLIEDGGTPA